MSMQDRDTGQDRRNNRRHEREDLVQRYREIQREMNSMRPPFKGKPVADIVSMLERRFGSELDGRAIERCAASMAAGQEIEISAPAAPAERPRRTGGDRRPRPDRDRER